VKVLLPILAALACLCSIAAADQPHFLVWRDNGRLRLLTENLANDIIIGKQSDPEAGEPTDCEIIFRDGPDGFEFSRSVRLDNGEGAHALIHQNRDGSVLAHFVSDSGPETEQTFTTLADAMRDRQVAKALSDGLQAAGQNPQILNLALLKFALGWTPRPDRDTRELILDLITRLDDHDYRRRLKASIELHRLAIYLPAVLENVDELNAEQQSRLEWALSDAWVDGTTQLITMAQDFFLDE